MYVREGAIVPMQPLVQSTEERPKGPLTIRVYPAASARAECLGQVYVDDGKSFAYKNGAFVRESFTCSMAPDGSVTVNMGPREGSFKPWWSEVRIEVIGFMGVKGEAHTVKGPAKLERTDAGGVFAVVPDDGRGEHVVFE